FLCDPLSTAPQLHTRLHRSRTLMTGYIQTVRGVRLTHQRNGTVRVTWDRDGFALDLQSLFSSAFNSSHTYTITLTTDQAFSGFQMECAVVERQTWDHTASGSDPDIYQSNNDFGGIFDLGSNSGQPLPGTGPVTNQSVTITPDIIPLTSYGPNGEYDPILIFD